MLYEDFNNEYDDDIEIIIWFFVDDYEDPSSVLDSPFH